MSKTSPNTGKNYETMPMTDVGREAFVKAALEAVKAPGVMLGPSGMDPMRNVHRTRPMDEKLEYEYAPNGKPFKVTLWLVKMSGPMAGRRIMITEVFDEPSYAKLLVQSKSEGIWESIRRLQASGDIDTFEKMQKREVKDTSKVAILDDLKPDFLEEALRILQED